MVFQVTETDELRREQTAPASLHALPLMWRLPATGIVVGATRLPEKPHRAVRDIAKVAILLSMAAHMGFAGAPNVVISRNAYGKPITTGDGWNNVSVSFSYGSGRLWAALSPDTRGVGVDCAYFREFTPPYPLHRAFSPRELRFIEAASPQEEPTRSAFVWSAKEAAVKALAVGFHRIDPLLLCVTELEYGEDEAYSCILIPNCMGAEFPQTRLEMYSFSYGARWVSIAAPDLHKMRRRD